MLLATLKSRDEYLAHQGEDKEGLLYVIVYGVLQVLQTQQDAVFAIRRIFELDKGDSTALRRIREIRHRSIGHPTLAIEKGQALAGFITRVSLAKSGFQLMIAFENDRHSFIQVNLPDLIREQRVALCKCLGPVLDLLIKDEKVHREKHKAMKLADLFHPTTPYYVQKVFEGILHPDKELGIAHVKMLQEELGAFRKELEARGDQFSNLIEYDLARVEHALGRLSEFFMDGGHLDSNDAYVFASFVEVQVDSLKAIASRLTPTMRRKFPNDSALSTTKSYPDVAAGQSHTTPLFGFPAPRWRHPSVTFAEI